MAFGRYARTSFGISALPSIVVTRDSGDKSSVVLRRFRDFSSAAKSACCVAALMSNQATFSVSVNDDGELIGVITLSKVRILVEL